LGVGVEGQLLHLTNPKENRFCSTRPLFHRYHRSLPLFADPVIFAGLTAGDYYIAVSSHKNVPDPDQGLLPGTDGIFDPDVSHSGSAGRTTGDYVLNLRVWSDDAPPHVVAATPAPGASLSAPPTSLTVQFDGPVNLQELSFQSYQLSQAGEIPSVYVQGADGTQYYPRLQSYDPATNQATFLMLDRLPVGGYALHLSGPLGLTDFAGKPLAGNDPGGDYVVPFTVAGTGVAAQPDSTGTEDLGVLFPDDLEGSGFPITGGADSYRFEVLQARDYFVFLDAPAKAPGVRLALTNDSGAPVAATPQTDGVSLESFLQPGSYVLGVTGLPAGDTPSLRVVLGRSSESPQPLTLGPAPVLQMTLAPPPPVTPPPTTVPPPPATVPPSDGQSAGTSPPQDGAGQSSGTGVTPSATPPAPAPASATAPVAASTTVAAARTTGPGDRVELPSGLLAALGAGPVGGVGAGTGTPSAAPQLSLGLPGSVAARDPARPALDAGERLSGVGSVVEEVSPDSQGAVVGAAFSAPGGQTFLRAAVATVVRLIGAPRRWLSTFLTWARVTPAGDRPEKPEATPLPGGEEAGGPETEDRPGGAAAAVLRRYAVVGAAALAVAASGLIVVRWRRVRGIDRPSAPGLKAGASHEPDEATVRI
jgi:hypothetical protein